jgi:hypothetical protein
MTKREGQRILRMCKETRERFEIQPIPPRGSGWLNWGGVCAFCGTGPYRCGRVPICPIQRAIGPSKYGEGGCVASLKAGIKQQRRRPIYRALDRIEQWVHAEMAK